MERNNWMASTFFLISIAVTISIAIYGQMVKFHNLAVYVFVAGLVLVVVIILAVAAIARLRFYILLKRGYYIFKLSCYIGGLYKFLGSSWRPPAIRLANISIVFFGLEWIFISLTNKIPGVDLFNGKFKSLINFLSIDSLQGAIVANMTSMKEVIVNGTISVAQINNTLFEELLQRGIIANMTSVKGVVINGTLHAIQINDTLGGPLQRGITYNLTLVKGAIINGTLLAAKINNTLIIGSLQRSIIDNMTSAKGLIINGTISAAQINDTLISGPVQRSLSWEKFFGDFFSIIVSTFWNEWQKILVIWFIFEFIRFALKTTQRLVIDEVTYFSSSEAGKPNESEKLPAKRLADLLVIYLDRINELYRVVDEERSIPSQSGAGKPIDASMITEDLSNILQSTSGGGTSELSLGPVKIPISSFTSLMGRALKGPRIVIGLHQKKKAKGENAFYLTATMTGYKKSQSWLVDSQNPLEGDAKDDSEDDSEERARSIEDMLKELAHRIFTNLAYDSSDKLMSWRASYKFNEGLRAYRDSLLTSNDRFYNLKKAEKKFIQALKEADNFSMAYYNLGVVHTELDQLDAAETAFLESIEWDPLCWDAYYALGLNRFYKAEACEKSLCKIYGYNVSANIRNKSCQEEFCHFAYPDIPKFCRDVLAKQYEEIAILCKHMFYDDQRFYKRDYARPAKAFNLKGHVNRHLWELIKIQADNLEEEKNYFNLSKESFEKAIGYSWIKLAVSELRGEDITQEKDCVSECLIDLADFYLRLYKSNRNFFDKEFALRAEELLNSAIQIDPTDANLYNALGETYCCLGNYDKAALVFEHAAGIAPEISEFWANFALANACAYLGEMSMEKSEIELSSPRKEKAFRACERVIIFGEGESDVALETAAKTFDKLNETDKARRFRRASLLAGIKECSDMGISGINHLKDILERNKGEDDAWKYAQFVLAFCRLSRKWKNVEYLGYCYNGSQSSLKVEIRKEINESQTSPIVLGASIIDQVQPVKPSGERSSSYLCREYIDIAIKKLIKKIDSGQTASRWEMVQDLYALMCLYIESYNFKKPASELEPILNEILECNENLKKYLDDCFNKNIYKDEIQVFSQVLICMGSQYLIHPTLNYPRVAEWCFRKAISLLEIGYPNEIKRVRLHSLLAKSLQKQDKKYDALKEAKQSQLLKPLNRDRLKVTGEIFCELEEYDKACEAFSVAASIGTDKLENPDILVQNGLSHFYRAISYNNKKERKRILKEALDYFTKAWKIYDRVNLLKRAEARYYIGRVYMEQCEYDDAIPHFLIIYNMATMGTKDKKRLIVALHLGTAYRKKHSYDECETLYRETIKDWCKLIGIREDYWHKFIPDDSSEIITEGGIDNEWLSLINEISDRLNELVSISPRDSMPMGQIIAFAMIGLASSYAERDARLSEGLILLERAENLANRLEKFKDKRIECQAANLDCKGWILYKSELLCNNEERTQKSQESSQIKEADQINEAIRCLEKSVLLKASSTAYFHLAKALELKLQIKDDLSKFKLKERAKACCKHAKELDIKDEYSKEIENLEKILGLNEAKEKPPEQESSLANLKLDAQATISGKNSSIKTN